MFVSCVLCLRSAFCIMLGAKTMLGATENMEFINILSLNTIFAGSLESANSSILAARRHFKEVVGEKIRILL